MHTLQSSKKAIHVAAFALLMGLQLGAQAQTADSGTINISGQISASTCALNMSDSAGTELGGTKTVNLGTLSASTVGTGTAGSTFGTAQTVTFSVKSTDGSAVCSLAAPNTAWDIALGLGTEDIVTIGGVTHLKNTLTTGATDAAVLLRGGITTASTTLTLRGGQGANGTLMSGGTTPAATAADSIVLSAQFVRSTAAAPTAGLYSATIPLLVVYK